MDPTIETSKKLLELLKGKITKELPLPKILNILVSEPTISAGLAKVNKIRAGFRFDNILHVVSSQGAGFKKPIVVKAVLTLSPEEIEQANKELKTASIEDCPTEELYIETPKIGRNVLKAFILG